MQVGGGNQEFQLLRDTPRPRTHTPGEDPPPLLFREALVWGRCRKARGGGLAVGLPIGGKDCGSNPHSVTKPAWPWTSPNLSFFTCRMGMIALALSHITGCVSKKWVQFHPSCHSMGKESERQDLGKKNHGGSEGCRWQLRGFYIIPWKKLLPVPLILSYRHLAIISQKSTEFLWYCQALGTDRNKTEETLPS